MLLGNQTPPPHCTAHPRVSPGCLPAIAHPATLPTVGYGTPSPKDQVQSQDWSRHLFTCAQAAVAPVKQRRRSPRRSVPRPGGGATYLCTSPGHPRRPGGTPARPRTGRRPGRGTPPCPGLSQRGPAEPPLPLETRRGPQSARGSRGQGNARGGQAGGSAGAQRGSAGETPRGTWLVPLATSPHP